MSLSKLTNLKLVSVIDTDNSTWQKLVPELGYSVKILSFTSAEEALPFVFENIPDVILFEYNLPGMTGIDFFEAIRKKITSKSILIMISSLDDGNMVLKFIQRGIRNYVIKDETLADSVKEIIMEEL